jgi:hypothetical protein
MFDSSKCRQSKDFNYQLKVLKHRSGNLNVSAKRLPGLEQQYSEEAGCGREIRAASTN